MYAVDVILVMKGWRHQLTILQVNGSLIRFQSGLRLFSVKRHENAMPFKATSCNEDLRMCSICRVSLRIICGNFGAFFSI